MQTEEHNMWYNSLESATIDCGNGLFVQSENDKMNWFCKK